MIAIVLLAIVSGVIGVKMHAAVQKKKFKSELARLRVRVAVSQRLAVAMQADWKGTLKRDPHGWIFETACEELEGRRLSTLHMDRMEIAFNGKKIDTFTIDFFASGHILPEGVIRFTTGSEKVEWKTPDIFFRDEGTTLGPAHP